MDSTAVPESKEEFEGIASEKVVARLLPAVGNSQCRAGT